MNRRDASREFKIKTKLRKRLRSAQSHSRLGDLTTILDLNMNFEGFQDLMRRIARTWYERAKVEVKFTILIRLHLLSSFYKCDLIVQKTEKFILKLRCFRCLN